MAGQPYIQFGSGYIYLNPNAGNLAVNPTAVRPFTIQDVKIGQKGKIEMLRGQNQYPDDTSTGDKDGTFEFSMGRKDYFLLNQIYNADTVTVGGNSVSPNESHTVAATVTVTPPASGTFVQDLGVVRQSNNQQFQRLVTGPPAAGQFTVSSGGVYTFASGDSGSLVWITYEYSLATGTNYAVNTQFQGYGPAFQAFIVDTYQPVAGVYSVVYLAAAKISDVETDNKRSGYATVSLKGSYYTGSNGLVINFFSNV